MKFFQCFANDFCQKNFTNEEKLILENFEKYKSSICDKFSSIIEWDEFNIENKIKEVIDITK